MINIPIFLSSDNNYAPFVATTISSICDHTDSFCEFYILDGGISKINKRKIESLQSQYKNFAIEFIEIDVEKQFKNFKFNAYILKSTYSRFLIPYVKPKIKKAIYSDVDVIALGDIKTMYEEDIENYAIGAVREEYAENKVDRKSQMKISEEHKYFYAGNLIINCEEWRKKDIISDIYKLEIKWRNSLRLFDMDLLNKYFEINNYKQLSAKYCYLNEDFEYRKEKNPEIIIRHFAGVIKPWLADFYIHPLLNKPYSIPNVKDFWKYAKETSFYEDLIEAKQNFLNSNLLYKRFNKMAEDKKI